MVSFSVTANGIRNEGFWEDVTVSFLYHLYQREVGGTLCRVDERGHSKFHDALIKYHVTCQTRVFL